MPKLNHLVHVFCGIHFMFGQTWDLNFMILVLQDSHFIVFVKKIKTLPAVNFEKAHKDSRVFTVVHFVGKNFIHCRIVNAFHRVSFTRSGLSISENCNGSFFVEFVYQRAQRIIVNTISSFVFVVGIVESERVILNVFCDPIDLEFWFVNFDLRVRTTDCITFACIFYKEKIPALMSL